MRLNKRKAGGGYRYALYAGIGTFLMATIISLPLQPAVIRHLSLIIAFPLLFLIILAGVIFDIIGVAVAVADETPFNAMAAKKIRGSRQALWLIRHADRVASFTNDIVGDLSATISGAMGAGIIFRVANGLGIPEPLPSIIILGAIAGLTVGGKAAGKAIALRRANDITFRVGRIIYLVREWFPGLDNERGRGFRRGGE